MYQPEDYEDIDDEEYGGGQQQDSGSVWTSYSDLFTTMAIIFLVMFVFALIKSGVNGLKIIQTKKENESYLQGKVPGKVKQTAQKNRKEITKSMAEMRNLNREIREKMKSLDSLAQKLNANRNMMHTMLTEQSKREAVMEHMRDTMQEVNRKSKIKDKQIVDLESTLKQTEKSNKYLQEQKQRVEESSKSLASKIENLNKTLKYMQDKLAKQQAEAELVKKEARRAQGKAKLELLNAEKQMQAQTQKQKRLMMAKEQELQREIKSQQASATAAAKALRSSMDIKLKSLEESYGKRLKELENKLKVNGGALAKLQNQNNSLSSKNKALLGEKAKLLGEKQNLQRQSNDLKQGSQEKLKELEGKLKSAQGQIAQLKGRNQSLGKANKNLQDSQAKLSAEAQGLRQGLDKAKGELRSNLGKELARRLGRANIKVEVDPHTGAITLPMDDAFFFKRNSSEISEAAKDKLRKIIPIYADVLFRQKDIREQIHRINIIGHASPTFGRTYVDPMQGNHKAFAYNLSLSGARAAEIMGYVLAPTFPRYTYSKELRKRTQAIGRGYLNPVPKNSSKAKALAKEQAKGPAINNKSELACGPYDCAKSRRVEISFTLREVSKGKKVMNDLGHSSLY